MIGLRPDLAKRLVSQWPRRTFLGPPPVGPGLALPDK